MFVPSIEQQNIISAPLAPLAVVACAGSGKTHTAIERLIYIREQLADSRSAVALLSFSNSAVNTFRQGYVNSGQAGLEKNRVTIETFDAFITSNVLRPHTYRTMGCSNIPYLINGNEGFLNNDKYWFWYESGGKNYPVKTTELHNIKVQTTAKAVTYYYEIHGNKKELNNGPKVFGELGKLGAYTHEFGKLWAIYTLVQQPNILRGLAKKYPHIIVDEAQDIGELHQELLEILANAGVKVSLIGDPAQAIYQFAGADGSYLSDYNSSKKSISHQLTRNYRSIPEILKVSNHLSGRKDKPEKNSEVNLGAFYLSYEPKNEAKLVKEFISKIEKHQLNLSTSAVVFRNHSGIENLKTINPKIGQGRQKLLAQATIERDLNKDYKQAFKKLTACIVSLIENAEDDLYSGIQRPYGNAKYQAIKLMLWHFLRDTNNGLPSGENKAKSEWQPTAKLRITALLAHIATTHGYTIVDKLGNKLTKAELNDEPLVDLTDLEKGASKGIRIDTVHQVKGESLDALLYVATKPNIEALLAGTTSEAGRIGYVAVTRAKYFFLLGIPKSALKALKPGLDAAGFKAL